MPKKQKLPEKCEAGGVRKWPSAGTVAGGLGGNARFTMVSRGPSPQFPHRSVYHIADLTAR